MPILKAKRNKIPCLANLIIKIRQKTSQRSRSRILQTSLLKMNEFFFLHTVVLKIIEKLTTASWEMTAIKQNINLRKIENLRNVGPFECSRNLEYLVLCLGPNICVFWCLLSEIAGFFNQLKYHKVLSWKAPCFAVCLFEKSAEHTVQSLFEDLNMRKSTVLLKYDLVIRASSYFIRCVHTKYKLNPLLRNGDLLVGGYQAGLRRLLTPSHPSSIFLQLRLPILQNS